MKNFRKILFVFSIISLFFSVNYLFTSIASAAGFVAVSSFTGDSSNSGIKHKIYSLENLLKNTPKSDKSILQETTLKKSTHLGESRFNIPFQVVIGYFEDSAGSKNVKYLLLSQNIKKSVSDYKSIKVFNDGDNYQEFKKLTNPGNFFEKNLKISHFSFHHSNGSMSDDYYYVKLEIQGKKLYFRFRVRYF